MNPRLASGRSLWLVWASPVDRMIGGPVWTRVAAGAGALWQYAYHDAFLGSLFFVLASGVFDYILGIKEAKLSKQFDSIKAQRGFVGKASAFVVLALIRTFEHYLYLQGLVGNTRGMFATAVAIWLFAVDLGSIQHHREQLGAQPIPLLDAILEFIKAKAAILFSAFSTTKLPDSAGQDPKP